MTSSSASSSSLDGYMNNCMCRTRAASNTRDGNLSRLIRYARKKLTVKWTGTENG